MRNALSLIGILLTTSPALAQSVSVQVGVPTPPSVVVTAPPPPRARVVVTAPPPPRAHVVVSSPPPPSVVVTAPPPPVIRFEAPPPLVTVEPGVQVVEDCDQDVFFVDGWFWTPGPSGVWYRTRDHRGGWVQASATVVPPRLVSIPPGQYRHWRRDERRAEHEERKAERREDKRIEKEERREERHGRGHGHGDDDRQ